MKEAAKGYGIGVILGFIIICMSWCTGVLIQSCASTAHSSGAPFPSIHDSHFKPQPTGKQMDWPRTWHFETQSGWVYESSCWESSESVDVEVCGDGWRQE